MFILHNKPGEQIVMPELDMIVTVLEVRGERVRFGITSPPDLIVHRHEVWERAQQLGASRGHGDKPRLEG